MSPYDPASWAVGTWILHAIGAYYFVNFFVHFVRFEQLGKKARAGDPEAVAAYNQALRGFPAAGYAKMLDRRPLVRDGEGRHG